MKSRLLFLLLLSPLAAICQNFVVTIAPNPLTARKYPGEQLNIPIDITLELTYGSVPTDGSIITKTFGIKLQDTDLPPSLKFSSTDLNRINHETDVKTVQFSAGAVKQSARVYITVPSDLAIVNNKAIMLEVLLNGTPFSTKQLTIEPANDVIYTTDNYFNKPGAKLDYVSKVESNNNILTVSGYKNQGFTKRQVLLEKRQALGIKEYNYIFGPAYLNSAPFSLVAIPFKIRPKAEVRLSKSNTPTDTTFTATAMSGITNLGINIDLIKWTTDRYFASGKKATHKRGIGMIITPGVEELTASVLKDTSLVGDKKSKQFYITVGLSAFYSYNGINFFIVPAALDWAPSSMGKQWIYNKKFWWGFGIGVSPTIIAQLFNSK